MSRSILDFILRRKPGKKTLNDLDPREIKKEIRKQEMKIERAEEDVVKLETEVQVLFQRSVGKSEHQKVIIAQHIRRKKREINDKIANINIITRAIGVLFTTLGVIEKAKVTFTGPVWDIIIQSVSIEDLETWVVEEKLKEEEILDKLKEIERLHFPERYAPEEDEETTEILEAMAVLEAGERDLDQITKDIVAPKKEAEKEPV